VRLSEADAALGRLAGSGRLLPDPHLLVNAYITCEAVSSSRIEGTQASVTEVFDAAVTGDAKRDDIREVRNYVSALEHGVSRLKTPGEFRRLPGPLLYLSGLLARSHIQLSRVLPTEPCPIRSVSSGGGWRLGGIRARIVRRHDGGLDQEADVLSGVLAAQRRERARLRSERRQRWGRPKPEAA
jgi:Fic/DOC family N-terminal